MEQNLTKILQQEEEIIMTTFDKQQNQTSISTVQNVTLNDPNSSIQQVQFQEILDQSDIQNNSQNMITQVSQENQSLQSLQTSVNYSQEENLKKTKSKSIQDSNSQLHEVCLKSSKSQNSDLQQLKLLQLLIKKIIGNSDFEIKIGNIDPQIQQETSVIVNDLKALGISTKLQTKKEYESRHRIYCLNQ